MQCEEVLFLLLHDCNNALPRKMRFWTPLLINLCQISGGKFCVQHSIFLLFSLCSNAQGCRYFGVNVLSMLSRMFFLVICRPAFLLNSVHLLQRHVGSLSWFSENLQQFYSMQQFSFIASSFHLLSSDFGSCEFQDFKPDYDIFNAQTLVQLIFLHFFQHPNYCCPQDNNLNADTLRS